VKHEQWQQAAHTSQHNNACPTVMQCDSPTILEKNLKTTWVLHAELQLAASAVFVLAKSSTIFCCASSGASTAI
jgi:hypothetical protein